MQGIQSKCSEFECFLIDNVIDFDFLCVSEHWLSNDELSPSGDFEVFFDVMTPVSST